jgi:hypothetical protein
LKGHFSKYTGFTVKKKSVLAKMLFSRQRRVENITLTPLGSSFDDFVHLPQKKSKNVTFQFGEMVSDGPKIEKSSFLILFAVNVQNHQKMILGASE